MTFEIVAFPMIRNANMARLLTSEVRAPLLFVVVKTNIFVCLTKRYVTKSLSGIDVEQR